MGRGRGQDRAAGLVGSDRSARRQVHRHPGPAFSGRGLGDLQQHLVGLVGDPVPGLECLFSGDTGYFDGFKAIGEKYGPFDVTMLETGAYDQQWPDVHMQPEETLQAFVDLKGKWLMPVHNGTFDLGLHAWREPFDRIAALAEASKQCPADHPGNGPGPESETAGSVHAMVETGRLMPQCNRRSVILTPFPLA
ncbi:MBL fold metallo-hydrolase [Massilia sp. B-10]|nr:MBL fold metallo-hydrolase [Massilia sp. B-10]